MSNANRAASERPHDIRENTQQTKSSYFEWGQTERHYDRISALLNVSVLYKILNKGKTVKNF